MKIGILQVGTTPDDLKPRHGDYDDLFKRLLTGRGFSFDSYPVFRGVLPGSPEEADAWLITGSKFAVYEDHDWIAPLEAFLRNTYAAGVRIVGICFGHQILAQALGGQVEKYWAGWSVGVTPYQMETGGAAALMAWHQDQVIVPPRGARVIGRSDFCAHAALAYGTRALTFQPHPEFDTAFMTDLLAARRALLPPAIAQAAARQLDRPTSSHRFAGMIETFFKTGGAAI